MPTFGNSSPERNPILVIQVPVEIISDITWQVEVACAPIFGGACHSSPVEQGNEKPQCTFCCSCIGVQGCCSHKARLPVRGRCRGQVRQRRQHCGTRLPRQLWRCVSGSGAVRKLLEPRQHQRKLLLVLRNDPHPPPHGMARHRSLPSQNREHKSWAPSAS